MARRNFQQRLDILESSTNLELIQRYRLDRDSIEFINNQLEYILTPATERNHSLASVEKLLIALRFYATGTIQLNYADIHKVSQPTVSRVITQVTDAISDPNFICRFIKFPTTPAELAAVKQQFHGLASFPNVIGAVDGTHIQIQAPTDEEEYYVNRMNYHSINTQVVFDAECKILDVVARWPGATHDARILRESGLWTLLQGGHIPAGHNYLLGDSGYPCKRWLLTPYLNPQGVSQISYNRAHKQTRSVVERGIGQLKRRWAVLHNEIRMQPVKVCKIQRAWRLYLEKQASKKSRHHYGNKVDQSESLRNLGQRSKPFDIKSPDLNLVDEIDNVNDIDENQDEENCIFNPLSECESEKSRIELPPLKGSTANDNIGLLSPRQQRKHNFLNKAQKFAELKKIDSKVLPFDLHLHLEGNGESGSQDIDVSGLVTMSAAMSPSIDSGQSLEPSQSCNTNQYSVTKNKTDSLKNTACKSELLKGGNCVAGQTEHISKGSNSPVEMNKSPICDKSDTVAEHICDTNKEDNSERTSKGNNHVCDTKKGSNSCQNTVENNVSEKCSSSGQSEEVVNTFDVYNIETALPYMDWSSLEEKLKAASEEARQIQEARRNDREEIRKKLAMGGEDGLDDDDDDDDDEVTYKKPSIQTRLHSGLQICFMNESPGDTDNEGLSPRQQEIHDNAKLMKKVSNLVDSDNNLSSVTDLNNPSLADSATQSTSPPRLKPNDKEKPKDFHSRQEQLQNEAKMALAQAGSMAHMQLEIEKQLKKKSPMAEMVGIPGLGEKHRKKLGIRQLQQMNLTSIQVLYNDLQTQIESLNEELVHLLMERDELHMAQDSMLVDIEDLTRRAEELAERANMTGGNKGNKTNNKGKLPSSSR